LHSSASVDCPCRAHTHTHTHTHHRLDGQTALALALDKGIREMVELLTACGADVCSVLEVGVRTSQFRVCVCVFVVEGRERGVGDAMRCAAVQENVANHSPG